MSSSRRLITATWPTPESFYRERDNRTGLEVSGLDRYANTPVEIRLGQDAAGDPTCQRTLLLAGNLTARWARNIRLVVPDAELSTALRRLGDRTLHERMLREMREADPFGRFEVAWPAAPDPSRLCLLIGPDASATSGLAADSYCVDASGWSAFGRRTAYSINSREPATCAAAALAAAIGAADLFKRAIGHPRAEWLGQVEWCTWHQTLCQCHGDCGAPPFPTDLDLGRLLVAGVGAVGSALIYILTSTDIRGDVAILDEDRVETSNLNRSPLFTAVDAAVQRHKVDACERFLQLHGVTVTPMKGAWRDHEDRLGTAGFDAWVSLTNEGGVWAALPYQLPPVVLHATTTSGWGFAAGRHIPRREDCTACRLPRPHAEFRGPCAQGEIQPPAVNPVRAALPFLSAAAASLLAAELLKLSYPAAAKLPNAVMADLRLGLPCVTAAFMGPNAGCPGCQIAASRLWDARGGRSRYRSLSEVLSGSR